MKKRLKGAYVIGYEGNDHVIYRNGEVVYEGDTILYVGKQYPGAVDEELDMGLAIISPGFIDLDALVDIDHGILDVAVPRTAGDRYRRNPETFRKTELFSREELRTKHRLSYAQLIMNGITTGMPIAGDGFRAWAETYEEMADGAEIAAELGMRMYLGPSYRMSPSPHAPVDTVRGPASVQDAFRYVEDFDGSFGGLIRAFLSPCQLLNLTQDVVKETKAFSDSTGAPIRLHCAESPQEAAYLMEKYGLSPIEYLAHLEFLGARTLIPHAILTGPMLSCGKPKTDELALLVNSAASVVHTPIAESHGGQALYSFSHYLSAGVNMTMGTDTHPADMIQNLNFAWNLTRIIERGELFNPYGGPIEAAARKTTEADLFRAATTNGAKALGRDDLGKLAPGAKADIIVVELDSLRVTPIEDPIRTLIMNTTGANVRDVVINGRTVMRNFTLPDLDTEELREKAQQCFDKYKARYTETDQENRSGDVLFPPAFPIID